MASENSSRYESISSEPIIAGIRDDLQERTAILRNYVGIKPRLVFPHDNPDDPAVRSYTGAIRKIGLELGISVKNLDARSSAELKDLVELTSLDDGIHGIVVPLPLANPGAQSEVLDVMSPQKAVDGQGEEPAFDPATPTAVIKTLQHYEPGFRKSAITLNGQGAAVGAPLGRMLPNLGAKNVSAIDINTPETVADARLNHAKIVVTAVGKQVLTASRFDLEDPSPKTILDLGVSRSPEGKIVGDVAADLKEQAPRHWRIGVVRLLTSYVLLENVVTAAERSVGITADNDRQNVAELQPVQL